MFVFFIQSHIDVFQFITVQSVFIVYYIILLIDSQVDNQLKWGNISYSIEIYCINLQWGCFICNPEMHNKQEKKIYR